MAHSAVKRLYIMTGKGGVGKTTLSLAFTEWLREQGVNAKYVTLAQSSFDQKTSSHQNDSTQHIPKEYLTIEECAEGYITKKLNSSFIAKWIVKTAFFRSLINMIPGFSYVIFLGKMLEMIKSSNDNLTLVLDAPASGHTLTMLEATGNFKDIFQAGLMFEDTEKMLNYLYQDRLVQINIISLPTMMSLQEASELQENIKKIGPWESKIFMNHSLKGWEPEIKKAPYALNAKLQQEIDVMNQFQTTISGQFPYSAELKYDGVYKDLHHELKRLI